MPRKAREKYTDAIYHVMCRSMSEFLLFRDDEDKDYYLNLLKKYNDKYLCSLYAYCLMDTHLHLHLDPKGFDISKYMHDLNSSYVRYYNNKYARRGHVFQDRFESKILSTDEYNFAVSAYIHNNPHDIAGFNGNEEEYKYSSYGIYLGLTSDTHKLIDESFMMGLFNTNDKTVFKEHYKHFVSHQRDIGSLTELKKKLEGAVENEYLSGRTVILREFSPSKVISFISDNLMVSEKSSLSVKAKQKLTKYRSFTVYALRVLCGLGYREICRNMCNITISGCSRLCSRGYELLSKDTLYSSMFDELITHKNIA